MDLIPQQRADGTILYYPHCAEHNYWYKGRPPLTSGCQDCWMAYYFAQFCTTPDDKKAESVDQLESAIRHAAEEEDKGTFDFKPYEVPIIEYDKDSE